MKKLVLICWLMGVLGISKAQPLAEPADLVLLARNTGDSVLLRWAPAQYERWASAIEAGYRLERYTVRRNGEVLTPPEKVILAEGIRPEPLAAWRNLVPTNEYAAVAAQALYGEVFEVTRPGTAGDALGLYRQNEAEMNRYHFHLYTADRDFRVALLSGLGWVDANVRADEFYVYRLWINGADADTVAVAVDGGDVIPLMPLYDVKVQQSGNTVLLSWDGGLYQGMYDSYWVERSTDGGKTYVRTSRLPVTGLRNDDRPEDTRVFATDTLGVGEGAVTYRVRGLNPFGEVGPPSNTVVAQPYLGTLPMAQLEEMEPTKQGGVALRWSLSSTQGLRRWNLGVERAVTFKGPYQLVSDTLPPQQTTWTDPSPGFTNYYRIGIYENSRSVGFSEPYLYQAIDSLPPASPTAVTGTISEAGLVRLEWAANTEEDLDGYLVLRANGPREEYARVTPLLVRSNQYTDTISVQTLTPHVYYRIVALDRMENASYPSVPLKLRRPDRIAPSEPRIVQVSSDTAGIRVVWVPSASRDVAKYLLMRESEGTREHWALGPATTQYFDTAVVGGVRYRYSLIAQDSAGNRSAASQPQRVRAQVPAVQGQVGKVFTQVDREDRSITLAWGAFDPAVDEIWLYRAQGDEPLSLYRTLEGNRRQFRDTQLTINETYTYRLLGKRRNGSQTPFSQPIVIEY